MKKNLRKAASVLLTAAMSAAVIAGSAVSAAAEGESAQLPINIDRFSSVPAGFTTTHGAGADEYGLKVENGWLMCLTPTIDGTQKNVSDGAEFMTINIGSGYEPSDTINVKFDYTNGNGYTPAAAALYYQVGESSETYVTETRGVQGTNNDASAIKADSIDTSIEIPVNYKNTDEVKLILKVSAPEKNKNCATPRIQNLSIYKAIGDGVASVNDDYTTMAAGTTPDYLSAKTSKEITRFETGLAAKGDTKKQALLLDTKDNISDGDGILVNMTNKAVPGTKMKISLAYGSANYSTHNQARVYHEIDGELIDEPIVKGNVIVGDGGDWNGGKIPETEFTVPEYEESYRILIAACSVTDESGETLAGGGVGQFRLFNLYINPVQEETGYTQSVDVETGTEVNGTEDFAEETATYFTTTVTPDAGKTYTNMTVSAKIKGIDDEQSASKAITALSGSGSYDIGIVINTLRDNIETLKVTLD